MITDYGFVWGPAEVTRATQVEGSRVIEIKTPYRRLNVYVSPTGRSVRVFRDHKELK